MLPGRSAGGGHADTAPSHPVDVLLLLLLPPHLSTGAATVGVTLPGQGEAAERAARELRSSGTMGLCWKVS